MAGDSIGATSFRTPVESTLQIAGRVILRFLRNDDPKQAPAAASLFQKAANGTVALFVSAVTINEVFFAFTSFYKLTRVTQPKRS